MVKVVDLLKKRVLVTRESARAIEPELRAALREGSGSVELDFTEVEGMTPSFLDETIAILSDTLRESRARESLRIVLKNPPTRISSKFVAVGRSYNLSVAADDQGAWIMMADSTASKAAATEAMGLQNP